MIQVFNRFIWQIAFYVFFVLNDSTPNIVNCRVECVECGRYGCINAFFKAALVNKNATVDKCFVFKFFHDEYLFNPASASMLLTQAHSGEASVKLSNTPQLKIKKIPFWSSEFLHRSKNPQNKAKDNAQFNCTHFSRF